MTTATKIDFDQPTLFKEGRFAREAPATPVPRPDHGPETNPSRTSEAAAAPSPVRIVVPDADRRAGTVHEHGPAKAGGGRDDETPRRLDDVLSAAWDGLTAHHSVTCPVCRGSMAPRYGSGAKPVGGRCTRCGSTLG
jgi:hypothetical protein